MFFALLELADEIENWNRSLRRWAKEYGANLMTLVDPLEIPREVDDIEE